MASQGRVAGKSKIATCRSHTPSPAPPTERSLLPHKVAHSTFMALSVRDLLYTFHPATEHDPLYTYKNCRTDVISWYKNTYILSQPAPFFKTIECHPHWSIIHQSRHHWFVQDKEMRLEPCQLIPKVPQQMSDRAETRIQIFWFLVTLLSNTFLSTNRPPTPSYDYIYVESWNGAQPTCSIRHRFDCWLWAKPRFQDIVPGKNQI